MIRAGFLDPASRSDLIDLARDGSVAHRLARRANALVLLDGGMSCGEVAKVLLLDATPSVPGIGYTRTRASKAWRVLVMTATRAA